ncbi:hypothetical protein [Sphingomonas sp. UBA978]|uniref:hypothetical protein n=1 Tax=Sphingomonas sp. UBA978 TaxID=1947536 RepID=UPI0025E0AA73|nr:hypothetical protein [Sphingomonas sp. UBA978]
MKWPILILAGFAATASADKDTDYPHRDWGHVATLDMSVAEATACIARALDKGGSVLVLPVDGGNDIDYSVDVPWGKRPDAWERFKLRNDGATTTLRLFYRHPVSQKGAGKDVERLKKQCLRVSRVDPA